MSKLHHSAASTGDSLPAQVEGAASNGEASPVENTDPDYWYGLVDERVAADFLDLVPRTLQGWRQKGGGPPFVRLSKRCVKYRRINLKQHADERLRSSTSDPDPESAAA